MYLSQAVSLPAPLRVKSICLHQVQEVDLESAVVTCRVLVRTSPAVLVHSRQAHRGGMRPVPSRIARSPTFLIIGGAPRVQEPSAPRDKTVCSILVEIFCIFYSICNSLFLLMYLSQAVSLLRAPLRIKSDLFLCLHQVQEIYLESAVVTCRVLVRTSPAVLVYSRQAHRGGMRPVPSRIARSEPHFSYHRRCA